MFPPDIHDLAQKIIDAYSARSYKIVATESCTGGLITGVLTEIPGASAVVDRGFITYSDRAKSEMLDVTPELIKEHGAVSGEVAEAMAVGALSHSTADVGISVTGIAGPTGGSAAKPVGLVYIGIANRQGSVFHYKCLFQGDRSDVRMQAVEEAFRLLLSAVEDE